MNTKLDLKYEEELILHFDLPYHYLTQKELVNYVNSINNILNVFNEIYFKDKPNIELRIMSLEKGGVIQVFSILGTLVCGSFAFLDSELGTNFIKGLTGNVPNYYAKKIGLLIGDSIKNFLKKKSKNLEGLDRLIPHSRLMKEAINNKNLFYETALSNPDNRGFCFNKSHNFDIKRDEYKDYLYEIDDEIDYNIKNMKVRITSPDSEGKIWRGFFLDISGNEEKESKSFSFKDNDFLNINKHISTNEFLYGQFLITRNNKDNRRRFSLIKVLEYKGQQTADPLSDDEIMKMINITELNELEEYDDEGLINHKNKKKKSYENNGQTCFDFIDDEN